MSLDLFNASITRFDKDGDEITPPIPVRIAIENGTPGKLIVSGGGMSADEIELNENVSDIANATEPIRLTLKAPDKMPTLLGFQPAPNLVPVEVSVELRPRPVGGTHTSDAPFAAIIACWDIDAKAGEDFSTTNGTDITADAAVTTRICAGLAFQHPPDAGLGISNTLVLLNVESLGVSSGWIPLGGFDLDPIDFPPLEIPDEFYIPPLLDWIRRMLPDPPNWGDLPSLEWDYDFPDDFALPLGLRFEESHLRIARIDGNLRVDAWAKGLIVSWFDEPVASTDQVELYLKWNGTNYQFYGQFYQAKISSGDRSLTLPFGVLRGELVCARIRLGVFGMKVDGKDSFCFETLIELGGLSLSSDLSGGDAFYKTDARLLLRDDVVITAEPAEETLLFAGLHEKPVFKDYAKVISAHSFASDLKDPPAPGAPNEYGIEIFDGDYSPGERLFLSWSQEGNQLMEALAHDLLGRRPAGSVPDSAEEIWVALEVLFPIGEDGARETQLRLDWQNAPATMSIAERAQAALGSDASGDRAGNDLTTLTDGEVCLPGDLSDGIALPPISGNEIDIADTTGAGALALELPGATLRLARPQTHTVLLRSDEARGPSAAYLLQWFDGLPDVADGDLVAEAGVDFSLTPDDKPRQVQESGSSGQQSKFLTVKLGYQSPAGNDPRPEAIQVLKLRKSEAPEFLQVYDTEAPRLKRLLPATLPTGQVDSCPEPKLPAVPSVLLPESSFTGFSLRNSTNWRLLVASELTSSILKMFGQDEADKGRRVNVEIKDICLPAGEIDHLLVKTEIEINLFGGKTNQTGGIDPEISGKVTFRFDLHTLALSIQDDAGFALSVGKTNGLPGWAKSLKPEGDATDYIHSAKPVEIAGLELVGISKAKTDSGEQRDEVRLLALEIEDGRFRLQAPDETDLLLRFADLGEDGLTFLVRDFELGVGGLDLNAELLATTLKVPGLKRPFALNTARLVIKDSALETLEIGGSGKLPDLLNEAPVEIMLRLEQNTDSGQVFLAAFEVELGDGKAPIYTRGTRCKFDLTHITMGKSDGGGTKPLAWYFLVSGSLQFTPEGPEFEGELLEDFSSIKIEFENAPLNDEFFDHVELIVKLREPKRFKVFNLFELEVRSIGFHPNFKEFKQDGPAVIIGGQCAFADIGDVLDFRVDFHKCYLGFPADGEILPQVHFKGLRVEIATGGFKIAGRVDTYDEEDIKGFAGEGTILIPGLPELSAAFSFVKLRTGDGSFKRAWFIAIEAGRISFQIGPLPLYLRQVGLGFGYRYTSAIIKQFETTDKLGELIDLMLREISRHQSLARIDSWAPDPERAGERGRWSIGFEALFSMASANSTPTTYDAVAERKLQTVLAQLLLFLRSDLTFLAAAKVWLPVSADDWFEDHDGMRSRPLALGFMIYSAPKNRLLIHAAKGKNPYLGRKNQPVPEQVKKILDRSHFEATFLSEPGLVHAELGWPDRLVFGFEIGGLSLECRGGVLFRAENDVLVQGIYFSAHGKTDLGGGLSLGIVGVRISAKISVSFAMRLMIGLSLSRPLQSNIYAAVGIDVSVDFRIYAWFRLNLRFCKISIDLHFSLKMQIIVALEVGASGLTSLGFRGRATVMISVFGRGLAVRVAVGIGDVNKARSALEPYMRSFLEPGAIPPIPGLTSDRAQRSTVAQSEMEFRRRGSIINDQAEDAVLVLDDIKRTSVTIEDGFALALVKGPAPKSDAGKRLWIGWVMPNVHQEAKYFYPALQDGANPVATLTVPETDGTIWKPGISTADGETKIKWDKVDAVDGKHKIEMFFNKGSPIQAEADDGNTSDAIDLRNLLAGCYVPARATDYGNSLSPFPLNWTNTPFPLNAVKLAEPSVQRDERLQEPGHPAQSPRRNLDADHPYDQALLRATDQDSTEAKGDAFKDGPAKSHAVDQLREQALGNQAFLLKSFADDAQFLAVSTALNDDDKPQELIVPATIQRPTLMHLGFVVGVVAEECPAWLLNWTDAAAEAQFTVNKPHLTLDTRGNEIEVIFDGGIKPVIDFQQSDFSENPPRLENLLTRVDSETLNIGWDLEWGQLGVPQGEWLRDGNAPDPEDFLHGYRIQLFVDGVEDAIGELETGPGDLLVGTGEGEDPVRLKLRYQVNISLEDLGLPQEVSVARRFLAQITPIAQDRSEGRAWPADATQQPSATPLAADDAALTAEFDETEASIERLPAMVGTLEWRELVPPTRADIASTDRWQLILRPLHQLPLGAYPAEAADITDSGVAGLTGGHPQEGDIVLVLKPMEQLKANGWAKKKLTDPEFAEGDGTRPPMLQRWRLLLNQLDPDDRPRVEDLADVVLDHENRTIQETDALYVLAQSFLSRTNVHEPEGQGWRVFLRAMAAPSGTAGGIIGPVSDMVRVRLRLNGLRSRPGEEERIGALPLDHLEWVPSAKPQADQMKGVETSQGPIHRAAIVASDEGLQLEFLPVPGRDRGVEILWSAADDSLPIEATAAYELYEAPLDAMVNFDRAATTSGQPVPGFGPLWRKIRDIKPADRAVAQRAVTNFVQPEIWDSTPPAERATLNWILDKDRFHASENQAIPPENLNDNRPGWYSWSESELTWPVWPETAEATLVKFGLESEQAPYFEAYDEQRREPGDLNLDELRTILAARRDLGEYYAKRRLHPWLLIVVGTLAAQGAPASLTGIDGVARFEVEVSPGKPLVATEGEEPDPLKWMEQDLPDIDPLGWAALSQVGLAVTITLRDPVTGVYRSQTVLRREMASAIKDVQAILKAYNKLAPDGTSEEERNDERLHFDPRHVSIDLPLQSNWSSRAESGEAALSDNRTLAMLQLALRPVPDYLQEPIVEESDPLPPAPDGASDKGYVPIGPIYYDALILQTDESGVLPDLKVWLPVDVRIIYPAREGQPERRFVGRTEIDIAKLTHGEEPILICWQSTGRDGYLRREAVQIAIASAIEGSGVTLITKFQTAADQPLPTLPADPEFALDKDPFGRFGYEPSEWLNYAYGLHAVLPDEGEPFLWPLSEPRKDSRLRVVVDHLTRAFVVVRAQDEQADIEELTKAARSAMASQIYANDQFLKIYMGWAERYFAAAPITDRVPPTRPEDSGLDPDLDDPNIYTATAPKRTDPARLAPDGSGAFSYTHTIQEDWASQRAYAVRLVPRYWDMRFPGQPVPPPMFVSKRNSDGTDVPDLQKLVDTRSVITIPRRREIEPVHVIGLRNVFGSEGREYSEVSISDHVEASLTRANVTLARKLEFQDILRRFSIEFRHIDRTSEPKDPQIDWVQRLAAFSDDDVEGGVLEEAPDPKFIQAAAVADSWAGIPPDSELYGTADDFLSAVPIARFGATRLQTPAEPFYYRQDVEFAARASAVLSPVSRVRLPISQAVPPLAQTDNPPAELPPVAWADIPGKLEKLDDLRKEYVDILSDADKSLLEPFFAPWCDRFVTRFPRLFESLTLDARESYFQAETEPESYGRLPDLDARLEIAGWTADNSARSTIAVIDASRTPQKGATHPFILRPVSSAYEFGEIRVPTEQKWDSGLELSLVVAPRFEQHAQAIIPSALVNGGNPPARLPSSLLQDVPEDDLIGVGEMPAVGPMARLLAVLLRLTITSVGSGLHEVHLLAPLQGPRWLARSFIAPEATTAPITSPDLAIAIRALFDVERRRALALVGRVGGDPALLRQVEEADAAVVSDVIDLNAMADLNSKIETLLRLEQPIWILRDGDWPALVDPDDASNGDRLLVAARQTDPQNSLPNDFDAFCRTAANNAPEEDGREPRWGKIREIAETCRELGTLGYKPPDPFAKRRLMAHHGNLPPSEWKSGDHVFPPIANEEVRE